MKNSVTFQSIRTWIVLGILHIFLSSLSLSAQSCSGRNTCFKLSDWIVEKESDATSVIFTKDTLEVSSPKGITIWYNNVLSGDLVVIYDACVIMQGGANDRLSDLNCFWMANDPQHPTDFFARADWRKGIFSRYYSLKQYYVGFGGNGNTTSRFRKYDGDYDAFKSGKVRPDIIREYTDNDHLLKPNIWYRVKIEVKGNKISYSLNDEKLFEYNDSTPYRLGYFGFRTVQSHQKITNLQIRRK